MLLEKNIIELRDYSDVNVFKDASVYPIVFLIQNNKLRNPVSVVKMKTITEAILVNSIEPTLFYSDIYWDKYFVDRKNLDLIIKISKYKRLDEQFPLVLGAATVGEAYEIKERIQEKGVGMSQFKKLINTGTIDPYISLWGKQKTQYIKAAYQEPIILDDSLKSISLNRFKQAESSKIIIAGMSRDLECFYDNGEYLAGKTTIIILGNPEQLKILLGILNSRLISYWYRIYFNSLSLAGGYFQISTACIKQIPLPNFSENSAVLLHLLEKVNELLKLNVTKI